MEGMTKLLTPNAVPDTLAGPTGDTPIDTRLRETLRLPIDMRPYSPERELELLTEIAPELGVAPPESADPADLLKWKAQISPSREWSRLNEQINYWREIKRRGQKV